MTEEKPIDLVRWAWGLRRFAVWGLLVAVLAGAVGIFWTRSTPQTTVRAVTLLSGQAPSSTELGVVQHWNSFFGPTMNTYARLATSEKVLAPVAQQHGTTVAALQPLVGARLVAGSTLLEIRYTGSSEADATSTLADLSASLMAESARAEYGFAPGGPIVLTVVQPPSTYLESSVTSEADAAAASNASRANVIRLALVAAIALTLGAATTLGLALAARRRSRG
nr:hypothetical protein [Propionibacterium sp.]